MSAPTPCSSTAHCRGRFSTHPDFGVGVEVDGCQGAQPGRSHAADHDVEHGPVERGFGMFGGHSQLSS